MATETETPVYGELRHADGTPFPHGGTAARDRLDTFGRSAQDAVDDLAREVRNLGGLGTVDLGGVRGRVAVFAVYADGSDAGACSRPWFPRRRTTRQYW